MMMAHGFVCLVLIVAASINVASGFAVVTRHQGGRHHRLSLAAASSETSAAPNYQPTQLPDSLDDAAEIAALASANAQIAGLSRCRVDFDTSIGDETYTRLKATTEFMQKFATALSYAMIPKLQQQKQDEMMRVSKAKAELKEMIMASQDDEDTSSKQRKEELTKIVQNDGRDSSDWNGPKVRIYFPDEGSAALARRDWTTFVPPCVEFASCGGVQIQDISKDMIIMFYCPKASEAKYVEEILQESEMNCENLRLSVLINPELVDMGVTGYGQAGRLLRDRLIDKLMYTYYLRTLPWGALTRTWPNAFSIWQQDEAADGGYRLIRTMDRLPSNPEVEDIYDEENGLVNEDGGNVLDQLGGFINGMMKL